MTRVELCAPVPCCAVPRHRSTCRYTGCRVTNKIHGPAAARGAATLTVTLTRVCAVCVLWSAPTPHTLHTTSTPATRTHTPDSIQSLTQALSPHRHVQLHSTAERTQSRTLCDSAVSTPFCRRHTVHLSDVLSYAGSKSRLDLLPQILRCGWPAPLTVQSDTCCWD